MSSSEVSSSVEPLQRWTETLAASAPGLRGWRGVSLEPLGPITATRGTYRAVAKSHIGQVLTSPMPPTAVLIHRASGLDSDEAAAEVGGTDERPGRLSVGVFLERAGLPVPHVFGWDASHGLLLLSDLGSARLTDALAAEQGERRTIRLRRAVQLAVRVQQAGRRSLQRVAAVERRVDQTYLRLRYERALAGVLSARAEPPPAAAEVLHRFGRDAARRLDAGGHELVHRRFRPHNVALVDDTLWLLGFQDACLGPLVCDLATLLVSLGEPDFALHGRALAEYFAQERRRAQLPAVDEAQFWEHVCLYAVLQGLDDASYWLAQGSPLAPEPLRVAERAAAELSQAEGVVTALTQLRQWLSA